MLKPPWVGRAELEAVAGTATQVEFMAEFDREQYWKSRGEQAIRDEMERAVERWRAKKPRRRAPPSGPPLSQKVRGRRSHANASMAD